MWPRGFGGRNLILAVGAWLSCGCGGGISGPLPAASTPSAGDVFGGKTCEAVRNPAEPKLTAWDPDDRAQINALRSHGAVAVRYAAKGCNVELEVLPNCTADVKYDFTPTPATRRDYIENQRELFADLPLGAAKLSGELSGNRVLRTDYTLVGVASLASADGFSASQLHGPDCARATDVIARIYLGGFSMAAGDAQTLKAQASLFGGSAAGKLSSSIEHLSGDGNADACAKATQTGEESPLCDVPLRIGLLPIDKNERPRAAPVAAATATVAAPAPEHSAAAPSASTLVSSRSWSVKVSRVGASTQSLMPCTTSAPKSDEHATFICQDACGDSSGELALSADQSQLTMDFSRVCGRDKQVKLTYAVKSLDHEGIRLERDRDWQLWTPKNQ